MIRALLVAIVVMVAAFAASACGGSRAPGATTATTSASSPLTSDHWKPPVAPGPASTAKFCTLLVADYDHLEANTRGATLKVRQQIVADFIHFTPTVIAAAPPPIAGAAATYLGGVTKILTLLNAAGLDAAKTPQGSIGLVILDPKYIAAGPPVTNFVQQNCNYNLAGVS